MTIFKKNLFTVTQFNLASASEGVSEVQVTTTSATTEESWTLPGTPQWNKERALKRVKTRKQPFSRSSPAIVSLCDFARCEDGQTYVKKNVTFVVTNFPVTPNLCEEKPYILKFQLHWDTKFWEKETRDIEVVSRPNSWFSCEPVDSWLVRY